ncbi:MAG TPA: PKD domain-containing protein [Saprospiraceae bacterium]|nr:PKD domain-containing protein [Saprospiraceae bacterium]
MKLFRFSLFIQLLAINALFGQAYEFAITGTVYTVSRATVPQYEVSITNSINKKIEIVRTDRNGAYTYQGKETKNSGAIYTLSVIDPCANAPATAKIVASETKFVQDFVICDSIRGGGGGGTGSNCPVKFTSKQLNPSEFEFTAEPDYPNAKYYWTFGDGQTAEGKQVKNTYAKPGRYNITLTLVADSCKSQFTGSIVANPTVPNPTAPKSWEAGCCGKIRINTLYGSTTMTPYLYNFSASSDFKANKVVWNFGDGSKEEEGINVQHKYDSVGRYLVSAYMESEFCKVTVSTWIQVVDQRVNPTPCNLEFKYTLDSLTGTFYPSFRSSGYENIMWSFGDGKFSKDSVATHTYDRPGIYKVTLSASLNGKVCDITKEITVGKFTGNPCNLNVSFKNDSFTYYFTANYNTKPDSVVWEFGDRTSSNELNPVHQYAKEGTYQGSLTVFSGGRVCTVKFVVQVKIRKANATIEITNISPNPAQDQTEVEIKSDGIYEINLVVSDLRGNAVITLPMQLAAGSNLVPLKLDQLQSGFYYVYVYYNNAIVSKAKIQKI